MANAGGNGGFPAPKGVPRPKGVPTSPKYTTPANLAAGPNNSGFGMQPTQKPAGFGKPKTKTVTRVTQVNGPGGMDGYQPGTQTRQVAVKAHTRTVKTKPVAAPTTNQAASQSSLPPTTDKPTGNGVGTGAHTGYFTSRSQVQLQPGETLGFRKGFGYYANPARQAQAAAGTNGASRQLPNYSNLLLYPGQTPEQLAQAALQPQYAALDQNTAAQTQALTNFTTAILQAMGQDAGQVQDPYGQAIQTIQQNASQGLRGASPAAANNAILGAIGAPGAQRAQLGQIDQSLGGTTAGGTADTVNALTDSLGAQSAAALQYAQQLPGIQGLAAQQAVKNLLYQAGVQRAQIGAQLPTLTNQYATAQADSAAKVAGLEQNAQALGIKTQQQNFNNQVTLKRLSQTDTSLGLQQDRINYQQAAKQAGLSAASKKIDPSVSKVLGYVATANGTPLTTKDGKLIPIAASGKAGAPKAPTANEIAKLVQTWHDGKVENVRLPVYVDANGNDHIGPVQGGKPKVNPSTGSPIFVSQSTQAGNIGYGQAYRRLIAMRVPEAQARQYLNTAYQRGENGRSWVSNTEQAALLKAGLPPRARIINKRGVLSPKQTAVLRKAGLLPAGQLTREGFYVIAPGF